MEARRKAERPAAWAGRPKGLPSLSRRPPASVALQIQRLHLLPRPRRATEELEARRDARLAREAGDAHTPRHGGPADVLDELGEQPLQREPVQRVALLARGRGHASHDHPPLRRAPVPARARRPHGCRVRTGYVPGTCRVRAGYLRCTCARPRRGAPSAIATRHGRSSRLHRMAHLDDHQPPAAPLPVERAPFVLREPTAPPVPVIVDSPHSGMEWPTGLHTGRAARGDPDHVGCVRGRAVAGRAGGGDDAARRAIPARLRGREPGRGRHRPGTARGPVALAARTHAVLRARHGADPSPCTAGRPDVRRAAPGGGGAAPDRHVLRPVSYGAADGRRMRCTPASGSCGTSTCTP